MTRERKESDPTDVLSGSLRILGMQVDLGELLSSPEHVRDQLAALRERLKQAGGRETLSDEEWGQGAASVTGYIRTSGILGEQEYHVGTFGKGAPKTNRRPEPVPPDVVEPPVDLFDEPDQVLVIADVPGVTLKDLDLRADGKVLTIATKPGARRGYQKEIRFETELDPASMKATCRNGMLEIRLRKAGTGETRPSGGRR